MARLDAGNMLGQGASGAISGFGIGGPIGGVAGGLLGLAGGLFGGRKKKKKRSTLDKRQQMINQQQQQGILGQGPLADLYNYNPEMANQVFDKTIGRPAYRNFEENIIPKITGQFRGQGLGRSSYAGDALSKAGRDIQEGLDAQRAQYLYGQENEARGAKRNAIENYQNRTNFDYDTSNQGGFNIGSILKSVPSEAISGILDYFKKNPGASVGGQ